MKHLEASITRLVLDQGWIAAMWTRMGRADAGLGTELREMAEISGARATPPHVTHHTALLHCTRHSEDTLLQGEMKPHGLLPVLDGCTLYPDGARSMKMSDI